MGAFGRRLEDRIRELCSIATDADDADKKAHILSELQSSIHQYTERLRKRASVILGGNRVFPQERRRG